MTRFSIASAFAARRSLPDRGAGAATRAAGRLGDAPDARHDASSAQGGGLAGAAPWVEGCRYDRDPAGLVGYGYMLMG